MGGVARHDNYRGTAFFKILQRTQQTFSRTAAAFSGKIVAAIGTAAVAVVNHGNVVSVAFCRNPALKHFEKSEIRAWTHSADNAEYFSVARAFFHGNLRNK